QFRDSINLSSEFRHCYWHNGQSTGSFAAPTTAPQRLASPRGAATLGSPPPSHQLPASSRRGIRSCLLHSRSGAQDDSWLALPALSACQSRDAYRRAERRRIMLLLPPETHFREGALTQGDRTRKRPRT